MQRIAVVLYAGVTAVVIVFQLALAAGAPWGEYAMGGAYPGRFPPALRVAAIVQALILVGFLWVIATRGGLLPTAHPKRFVWLTWVIVAYSVVGFVLNVITPSAGERLIWAPVTLVMLICSLVVAVGRRDK
jgi:hypothetical protein